MLIAKSIQVIEPTPYKRPDWMHEDDKAAKPNVEISIAKFKPARLPRGCNVCLVICVYIPKWTKARKEAVIYQLRQAIDIPISKCITDNRPLIMIGVDFNGANISSLCADHNLHQLNKEATFSKGKSNKCLDIILTNAPKDIYECETRSAIAKCHHRSIKCSESST